MQEGLKKIQAEMKEQVKKFTEEGKLLEAQRIQQRTNYDMEMLQEVGMCKGIENYSRCPVRPCARLHAHNAAGLFPG